MKITFQNRVAIITGAGHGLGKSYALFLASRGAKVVVNDLGCAGNGTGESEAPAKSVVEEIKAGGGKAVANMESVAVAQGAQRIVEDAIKHFGSVDILINNAGILRDRTFLKMPLTDFELVLKVHLLGPVYLTRAAFPFMKEKGYGRIVMTTSAAGLFGNFGQTNYSAAKMGVVGFMNALKLEGEKYNILTNTIAPLAYTRLADPSGVFPGEIIPLLKPDLVTPLVAYLCSEACRASGDIISAGGGHFAGVRMMEGPGMRFDPNEKIAPETIAERYDEIMNMEGAVPVMSARDELRISLGPLMNQKTQVGDKNNGTL
jgi:NAD(P)-dependent dehydrogenase (short-subunit alcohol dehydrogenase family)